MIADSSSRLQRGGTGGSLATALRGRGPCVIPVQPNRSLPIRPAPPTPTRPASIAFRRIMRSPILKLSRSASSNMLEMQSERSLNDVLTDDFSLRQRNSDKSELVDRTECILSDNVVQVMKHKSRKSHG